MLSATQKFPDAKEHLYWLSISKCRKIYARVLSWPERSKEQDLPEQTHYTDGVDFKQHDATLYCICGTLRAAEAALSVIFFIKSVIVNSSCCTSLCLLPNRAFGCCYPDLIITILLLLILLSTDLKNPTLETKLEVVT